MQPDLTVLGIVFGVNIGFSAIDSLVGDLLKTLRRCTGKRIAKYRDSKWIESIAPTDTAKDEAKRNLLAGVIRKVLDCAGRTDNLFRTNAAIWKAIMAISAIVAFVFMAIPFAPRWAAFLILPVPLCFISCLIELLVFNRRLGKKCNEVEMIYSNLKEDDEIPKAETDSKSVESRLSAIEAFLAKQS